VVATSHQNLTSMGKSVSEFILELDHDSLLFSVGSVTRCEHDIGHISKSAGSPDFSGTNWANATSETVRVDKESIGSTIVRSPLREKEKASTKFIFDFFPSWNKTPGSLG
jgi:hypothetical protein